MRKEGSDSKNICVQESSSTKELRLTLEVMNEAARDSSNGAGGLSTIHLGPKWMDRNWGESQDEEEVPFKPPLPNITKNRDISESPSVVSQVEALDLD